MTNSALRAIGHRIRALREMADMTQAAFAEKCHVTQPAVSQWERGVTLPSRSGQHRVADVLRTSRSMLFREVIEAEADEVVA